MLAYAANRPVAGKRPSSPPTMLLIVSAHVALLALAMSAKMEYGHKRPADGPTIYIPPAPPPPPPVGTSVKRTRTDTLDPRITKTPPETQLPPAGGQVLGGEDTTDPGPIGVGGGTVSFPALPTPIRHEPRLLTSPSELKPPYPELKILSGEEATLQLRLTINESGRVTAVDAVGPADRVFLDAARRYLIARWRYAPATVDGRPTASSIMISLRFQLDG